ncbi:MAG TPA: GTPase ObgE [Clostridiales bacterium]|nr:GTPase ObgE [Clostridiales bacterium]
MSNSFVDTAVIQVRAGDGGDGLVTFRREKHVPRGGPSGGDGGDGGDLVVAAAPGLTTLLDYRHRRHLAAGRGGHGGPSCRHGHAGQDKVLLVPLGTQVFDADTGELLADLIQPDQQVMAAKGGRGGRGNARFATATQRTPRHAEPGGKGEQRTLRLELSLLADVGLVGMPNAGKSSLLSRVSAARPRIGPYPFTTRQPALGVVSFGPGESLVLADIPGLIEGAHEGAGLGHQFLRHVSRTRFLVHVVDLSGQSGLDPFAAYEVVRREMAEFDDRLISLPELVAANKVDLAEARANLPSFRRELASRGIEDIYPLSAATGEGVKELLDALRRRLTPDGERR